MRGSQTLIQHSSQHCPNIDAESLKLRKNTLSGLNFSTQSGGNWQEAMAAVDPGMLPSFYSMLNF